MGEYVYTVICAALVTAVILSLSPEGDEGQIGKYVAFAGALVIALTMLAPIPRLISNGSISSFDWESDVQEEKNGSGGGEYYANSAGTVLCELYGADPSKIVARVTESDSGEILKITLLIKEAVDFSTEEAGKILSQIYKTDIEVKEESNG